MDVRSALTTAGICLALLIGGCSPGDEKQVANLDEKTATFEQSLDTISDPKLKDANAVTLGATPFRQAELDAAPGMMVVARLGVGFDAFHQVSELFRYRASRHPASRGNSRCENRHLDDS